MAPAAGNYRWCWRRGRAAIIAVTTFSPFGEPEPYLRFGTALALASAAFGAVSAGRPACIYPGGALDLLRNVAGLAGLGLLSSAVVGGAPAWVGPMADTIVAAGALSAARRTPWTWPARPPHDAAAIAPAPPSSPAWLSRRGAAPGNRPVSDTATARAPGKVQPCGGQGFLPGLTLWTPRPSTSNHHVGPAERYSCSWAVCYSSDRFS